jgi:hypothetical protein
LKTTFFLVDAQQLLLLLLLLKDKTGGTNRQTATRKEQINLPVTNLQAASQQVTVTEAEI